MRKITTILAVTLGSVWFLIPYSSSASTPIAVLKVYDGDTFTLTTGERVRLLQIDTPEIASAECYARESRAALISLLKINGTLTLEEDPALDNVDRYGRLLRYVFAGNTNINLKLVQIGAAKPYFYKGELGQYSRQIAKAAINAQAKQRGLWKFCKDRKPKLQNALKADEISSGLNLINSDIVLEITRNPNNKELEAFYAIRHFSYSQANSNWISTKCESVCKIDHVGDGHESSKS